MNSKITTKLSTEHGSPAIANPLLSAVFLPSEVGRFMSENKLSFGKWYDGGGIPKQLNDFVHNYYWGWSLVFNDKTQYRISLPFYWSEVEEPKQKVIEEYYKEIRKPRDADYYKIKTRHEILCQKKLELNRQGKNTTMRNAYINQELEILRSQPSEYAVS